MIYRVQFFFWKKPTEGSVIQWTLARFRCQTLQSTQTHIHKLQKPLKVKPKTDLLAHEPKKHLMKPTTTDAITHTHTLHSPNELYAIQKTINQCNLDSTIWLKYQRSSSMNIESSLTNSHCVHTFMKTNDFVLFFFFSSLFSSYSI